MLIHSPDPISKTSLITKAPALSNNRGLKIKKYMYHNDTVSPPVKQKSTAIRLIDHEVAALATSLSRLLGTDISVAVNITGLDMVTIVEASEHYRQSLHGEGDYKAVTYKVGNEEVTINNGGLPF